MIWRTISVFVEKLRQHPWQNWWTFYLGPGGVHNPLSGTIDFITRSLFRRKNWFSYCRTFWIFYDNSFWRHFLLTDHFSCLNTAPTRFRTRRPLLNVPSIYKFHRKNHTTSINSEFNINVKLFFSNLSWYGNEVSCMEVEWGLISGFIIRLPLKPAYYWSGPA